MFIQLLLLLAGLGSQGNLPDMTRAEEPVLSEDSQQQVRHALGNNQLRDFRYFGGHVVAVDWLNPPRGWVPDEYPIPRHWGIHGHNDASDDPRPMGSPDWSGDPAPGPAPLPPDNNPSPQPAPVPEPATLALLGLGGAGALLRRRRLRN